MAETLNPVYSYNSRRDTRKTPGCFFDYPHDNNYMSQSLDQLVDAGLKLLNDSDDPTEAHREHEYWVTDVSRWLQEIAPNSSLSGEWAAFGSSPLVYGGGYYYDPRAWVSHMSLVRRRLKWLSEKGSDALLIVTKIRVKRVSAKLRALRNKVARTVDFAWPDLHYEAEVTLEFLERYARLSDEIRSLQPELYSDLPQRELPENPQVTAGGKIAGHIPTYHLKALLNDIDYILEIQSHLKSGNIPDAVERIRERAGPSMPWDVFISHASEDKKAVAEPLTKALMDAGLLVWYDTIELKIGDSLRGSIDRGLRESRFGVIILSPAFFGKHWPQLELNGLAQKEVNGEKVILPIWYNVTAEDVRSRSPLLADRVAASWASGLETVVTSLLAVIQPTSEHNQSRRLRDSVESFRDRALISPKTAMMETWSNLVSVISDAGKQNDHSGEQTEQRTPSEIVNGLFQLRKITDEVRKEFFLLKKRYESAVLFHTPQEPKDALDFHEVSNALVQVFKRLVATKYD